MKVTIAKVEKLMDRADVSYEVANEALEAANGSLLDAIIALEQEGKFGPNAGRVKAAAYSTGSNVPATVVGQAYGAGSIPKDGTAPNFTTGDSSKKNRKNNGNTGGQANSNWAGQGQGQGQGYAYSQAGGSRMYKDESTEAEENIKRFFRWLGRVFYASLVNYFEIWRKGERIIYFPVVLFLFCLIPWVFWVALGLLLLGFFCGCRFRFSGPHLGRKNVNDTMDKAADAAEEMRDGEDPDN